MIKLLAKLSYLYVFVVSMLCTPLALAEDIEKPIPYKDSNAIHENAGSSITAIIVFLVVAGLVLMYLRKYQIGNFKSEDASTIKVIEVKRLTVKSVAMHIKVENQDVLVVQSGDSISMMKLDSSVE